MSKSNSSNPNATSAWRGCRASCRNAILLALPLVLLAGCSEGNFNFDKTLDLGVKNLFTPRRSPQQDMILAVSSEDPDVRRESAAKVADSKRFNEEWAIKGFVAIALLETNEQTRCVAVRALTRGGDPRAVETMIKILNYEDYPPAEVRPPTGLCRWDAAVGLANLSERGLVPEQQRERVASTLMAHLKLDSERQARIASARGLACYPEPASVEALVRGLRDEDFAVVHQCENSLVKLTGHTFNCDSIAWQEWVDANHDNLFADAGQIPESRRLPYNNRLEKSIYETKQFMVWLWPGTKE